MSGLSFQGIGSGMPVQKMIDAIMQAKQKPYKRVEAEIKQYDTKISDLGKLKGLLSEFKSSLDPFRVLKTAFEEQYSVSNSNDKLLTVTKKAGFKQTASTANFKLLDITNPTAEKNWAWSSNKVIADYKYKGNLSMTGVGSLDFSDKEYTLDEMVAKINSDPAFSAKLTAKKVLVNEHTDPSKNTYALRLESKIGGDAGALNPAIFAPNQVTNSGSTPGPATSETIVSGTFKTGNINQLNAKKPTYEIDLGDKANDASYKTLTLFYDKDKNGSVADVAGSYGWDEITFIDKKPGVAGAAGFAGTYDNGNITVEHIGGNKLRITQNVAETELDTLNLNEKPTVRLGKRGAWDKGGYAIPSSQSDNLPVTNINHNKYDGTNGGLASAGHIQPGLKQQWTSNSVTAGTTISEQTTLNVGGSEFDLKDKTLAQAASEINASSINHRVEAQVITDSSGNQQLQITSKAEGSAGSFSVGVETAVTPPTPGPSNDLTVNSAASQFNDLDEKDLQIRFSVNGQEYTRNTYDLDTSNIPGLEGVDAKVNPNAFKLEGEERESTIVTTKDKAETKKHTKEALQGFVDAYNKIVEFVNTQTQIEIKKDGKYAGSLQNDSTLKSILQSMDKMLSEATGGDLKYSMAMMGVMHVDPSKSGKAKDENGKEITVGYQFGKVNLNAGKLEIKNDLFEKALENGDLEKALSGFTKDDGTEVSGYADRFNKLSKWMINGTGGMDGFTGLIDMRTKTLTNQQNHAKDKLERMGFSMKEMRERLIKQFQFADTIAARMSSINATLAKQLGNSGLISSAMGKKM